MREGHTCDFEPIRGGVSALLNLDSCAVERQASARAEA